MLWVHDHYKSLHSFSAMNVFIYGNYFFIIWKFFRYHEPHLRVVENSVYVYNLKKICQSSKGNIYLNFQPLEVVSLYCNPQLEVVENYS